MRRRRLGATLLAAGLAGSASLAEAQIYTRVNKEGVVEATNVPASRGFSLTYPGKGTLIHSRGFRGAYHGEFDQHILDAASGNRVSPDLVRAVVQVESAFDHRAVSSKGAQGLMQLMPATARRLGVANAFDPRQNLFGGARYLRQLLDMFDGNLDYALAAYNAGENAVLRYGGIPPYKETREYVRRVRSQLGASVSWSRASSGSAMSFAPSDRLGAPRTAARHARREPARVEPAVPAVYYRWTEPGGTTMVATRPPPEGTSYTLIRALP